MPFRTLLTCCVMAAIGASAVGQSVGDAVRPGQLPVNDPGDVLARDPSRSVRWTLRIDTTLQNPVEIVTQENGTRRLPARFIEGETFRAVLPFIEETASSVGYMRESRMRIAQATRVPSGARTVIPDRRNAFPENTITNVFDAVEVGRHLDRFGMLSLASVRSERLQLTAELDVRSWATVVDEVRADAVAWPAESYPPNVSRHLGVSTRVDPTSPLVARLLDEWTHGEDPRKVRPYALAKHLAQQLLLSERAALRYEVETFGERRFGPDARFGVGGATDLTGDRLSIGRAYDLAVRRYGMDGLLCALYRGSGLPARVVIAYATIPEPQYVIPENLLESVIRREREKAGLPPVRKHTNLPRWRNEFPNLEPEASLRTWVEFALYDEQRGVTEWIPVDIEAQFEWSNRPPDLREPWRFFGNHADAHECVPFAINEMPPAGSSHPAVGCTLIPFRADFTTPPSRASCSITASITQPRAGEPFDPFAR